jgi:hypothetical protein
MVGVAVIPMTFAAKGNFPSELPGFVLTIRRGLILRRGSNFWVDLGATGNGSLGVVRLIGFLGGGIAELNIELGFLEDTS